MTGLPRSPVEQLTRRETGIADLTPEALVAWQLDRLREALRYARERSSYYRRTLGGLDLAGIRSVKDLERLPFTGEEQLRNSPAELLCVSQQEVERIVTLKTSGTVGPPKRVFFSRDDMEATVAFFEYGMSAMVGAGQRAAVFMEGSRPDTVGDLLRRALGRIGVDTLIHGFIRDLGAAVETARRADCFIGMPVQMLQLCKEAPELRPAAALLSADYVPASIVETLERVWECPVLNHYGMTETGFGLGVQCLAREGCHLRDTDFLLEIVDPRTGEQLPQGEAGEVVISSLKLRAMPLVRYRTGDISRILALPCGCGGVLPTLDRVRGRAKNMEAGSASIHRIDELLFGEPDVWDYTAAVRDGLLHLTVYALQNLDAIALEERLRNALSRDLVFRVERKKQAAADSKRRIVFC
jgi:phenylacetate-coenzyme A ligase PaaK-like adenylate-forming protein